MNINFSKISLNSSKLFFIVFLSYLFISLTHTHHFQYIINNDFSTFSKVQNNYSDPFLDSSLNCIIHSFNNSLNNYNYFSPSDSILKILASIDLDYNEFRLSITKKTSNQLRAPPKGFF